VNGYHALDRAARAYRVGEDVPNSCVRLGPIRSQTLTQELLYDDHLRRERGSALQG